MPKYSLCGLENSLSLLAFELWSNHSEHLWEKPFSQWPLVLNCSIKTHIQNNNEKWRFKWKIKAFFPSYYWPFHILMAPFCSVFCVLFLWLFISWKSNVCFLSKADESWEVFHLERLYCSKSPLTLLVILQPIKGIKSF